MASLKYMIIALGLAALLLLTGCNQTTPTSVITVPTNAFSPIPAGASATPFQPKATPSPLPPSPTPVPMVARVNNEGIPQAEFDEELQRLGSALAETGKEMSAADQKQMVLKEMVDQVLLSQAAVKAGYQLSDADFQKNLDDVVAKSGGEQSFADWLKRNFYSPDSFRQILRRSLAAAWQRDQVIAKVPTSAEQVHARQILVLNEDLANRLYSQLKSGADFATLALQVDPDSGGELGWFPRGYLFLPEIEKTAFSLQPGQYSPILKTSYGFQIVLLIEKDANRPLAPDALLKVQRVALQKWLDDRRAQSQIDIYIK